MFLHLFIYRLKVMLRSKSMVFWTMVFPIALSIFFSMAFGGLSEQGNFNPINIALVDTGENPGFIDVVKDLSTGENRMFNTELATLERAEHLLTERAIAGFIITDSEPTMTVATSGIQQSIMKTFLDQYNQTSKTVSRIVSENPAAGMTIAEDISRRVQFTNEVPASNAPMNILLVYFYSLIAMTSFYGSFFGLEEVVFIQANLSAHAARVNLSPTHKLKSFLYSLSASLTIHLAEMFIFIAFLYFVLGIEFGPQMPLVLLTLVIGSMTGISMGAFVAAVVKGNANMKAGILIGTTMLGSFLAGMMVVDMKYWVQTKVPILAWLNPVNLLADAFYALYYFDAYTRYWQNITGLLIFAVLFCSGTYMVIRRQKYASL